MSKLAQLPVSLPEETIPQDIDIQSLAQENVGIFDHISAESFREDAVWRDSYALTGTLRTFYGAQGVSAAWSDCEARKSPRNFNLIPSMCRETRLPTGKSWVELAYTFETTNEPPLICTAFISLTKGNGISNWKIWVLRTVLDQLKGYPSVDVYEPPALPTDATQNKAALEGQNELYHNEGVNGSELNGTDQHLKARSFDCVIVGAGQAGLDTAGRCQALGLSYVVVEKNEKIGDNWRSRYDSARLHTIREYAHMPFDRTFGPDYTEFLGKDDLAKGYTHWVEKFGINVWLLSSLISGKWDDHSRKWTLVIDRGGREELLESSFVIMAVGAGGQVPVMPYIPGKETFLGTVLHSEQYKNASAFTGKHGIVVGTANTAHDIAEDMLEAGCKSTTMLQRSETFVLPVEWYRKTQELAYNAKIPTHVADKIGNTNPYSVLRLISMETVHAAARAEPERFEALKRAGFKVDVYGDPVWHLYERLGGHYMDVGASAKIANGLIKVKSDAMPTNYTPSGLAFSDGTELPADLIVFATGFDLNIQNRVEELFGEEVASQIGEFSAMDKEGELAGAYKFTHPGLACNGGAIGPCRWYSRFLALAMKAAVNGTPLQVYSDTPDEQPHLN